MDLQAVTFPMDPVVTDPGQQTLFDRRLYDTPLPPAAALSLDLHQVHDSWSEDLARSEFRRLFGWMSEPMDVYNRLLECGCPLLLADEALAFWTADE